jgi:hypothetical protein
MSLYLQTACSFYEYFLCASVSDSALHPKATLSSPQRIGDPKADGPRMRSANIADIASGPYTFCPINGKNTRAVVRAIDRCRGSAVAVEPREGWRLEIRLWMIRGDGWRLRL